MRESILTMPRTAYDSMIVIKVTESGATKEFQVYRGVLRFHSEFFKRALSNRWQSGSASVYEITDTKIATFETFFNWMNTDSLLVDKTLVDVTFRQIVEVFKFADFYLMPGLKNRAMEAFFNVVCEELNFDVSAVANIYEHSTPQNLFRKLAVDIAVDIYEFDVLSIEDPEVTIEFLKDVIMASRAKNTAPGRGKMNASFKDWKDSMAEHFCGKYHYHGAWDAEVPPGSIARSSNLFFPSTRANSCSNS